MLNAYPKIFAIGTDYIKDIFEGEVEVTEKIDGSQFVFGKFDGVLYMRSKGAALYPEKPEKMFKDGMSYIDSIQESLPDGVAFYCEYLRQPRHNILTYQRIPKNGLALFGAMGMVSKSFSDSISEHAEKLNIDSAPVLFKGNIESVEQLTELLETDSFLGGNKVEGVVVKNYAKPFLLGGQPIPIMAGKFVSEQFKEKHKNNWGKEYSQKGKWQAFIESFKTEARWHKAIQHLRDTGQLENSPRDIGKLIKEIQHDIADEEKDNIKDFLWREFGREVLANSTKGFPEWYKEHLLQSAFSGCTSASNRAEDRMVEGKE